MNMMEIWFWKPIGEFFGTIAIYLVVIIGIAIYFTIDHYILNPLRVRREKELWASKSTAWRRDWYDYSLRNNRAQPWMYEMIEADNLIIKAARQERSKNVCGND